MVVYISFTDLSNIEKGRKENISGPKRKFCSTLMEIYNHSKH
jgi:hypothetical protein